jgi:hypothetical protein
MVTQTDKDKEGTATGAGDATDELEQPEAAGPWWKNMKRTERRNETKQQERQMKSTGGSSGTAPHMVLDELLKSKRTRRTSGTEKTYNKPLAVESRNQQKVLILADDMMKDDLQAERYGNRLRTKRKSSLRVLLQSIQRPPLSIRNQKHKDIVNWIQ